MSAKAEPGLSKLGQIAMTVRDVAASTAFYRDVLGLPFLFAAPGLAFFDCAGVRLMLAESEGGGEVPAASPLYFAVEDLDSVHAALLDRGAPPEGEPHVVHRTEASELWMAAYRDPDGHVVLIMEDRPLS